MITFYIHWLRASFAIQQADLILRVSINSAHAYRITTVEQYWSTLTGIPRAQFTKPSLIVAARKKRYATDTNHFGTLRIKVRRGTRLRREILGGIAYIATHRPR
jgi:hypothetical protein